MQIKTLDKRLDKVEELLNPKATILYVILQKGETDEQVISRAAKENGFSDGIVPNSVAACLMNFG